MLSHKYGSAHESVVGNLYSGYDQQGLHKKKVLPQFIMAAPYGVFFRCHGGGMSKHYLFFQILEKWPQKHTDFLKLFVEMVYLICVRVFDAVRRKRGGS